MPKRKTPPTLTEAAASIPADEAPALAAEYPNLWEKSSPDDRDSALAFAEEYMRFLDLGKTERECVTVAVEALEELGFVPLASKESLEPGDRVYADIRGKGLMAAIIGSEPVSEGLHLVGAHLDAPRLDLKPTPLYEDGEMAFLKTHYYGGIKKYQWTSIPLALRGVAVRRDGSRVRIALGDGEGDPVLTITDLLPHLGAEQMQRKGSDLIKGEELNILVGGIPTGEAGKKDRFRTTILEWFYKRYGLFEKDLVHAEIEVVPAGKSRHVGLDGSFIGAYAQDDRVCSFTALMAFSALSKPARTCVLMLSDKEEIGSEGNTGAQSRLYDNFLAEMFARVTGGYDELGFRAMMARSRMLSADVTNGFDPTFASVSDPRNNAYLGRGIVLTKYTGSRGKSSANDANGEFLAGVIRALDARGIPWQTGELGKVDAGGGGTIAKYMAEKGMEVVDCGVPVLSMHSPFEITSKIDVYFTYLAYACFYETA